LSADVIVDNASCKRVYNGLLVNITEDLLEGSLDKVSRAAAGVGLFEIESSSLTLELRNIGNKYYATDPSHAINPIQGSLIGRGGIHDDDWRVEYIQVWEEQRLRYVGYIFATDNPVVHNSTLDTVAFTVYDPLYILKLFMVSPLGYTLTGADAVRYRERYIREENIEGEENEVGDVSKEGSPLYVIDKGTYDLLPVDEQVRWEETYLFDTFGGIQPEINNEAYERVELVTINPAIDSGIYAYKRRLALPPAEIAVLAIINQIITLFNSWTPCYTLKLVTEASDVDFISGVFKIKLEVDDFDNVVISFRTINANTLHFLLSFKNAGDTDDGYCNSVSLNHFVNYIQVYKAFSMNFRGFPSYPEQITFGLELTTRSVGIVVLNVRWTDLVASQIHHRSGIIESPAQNHILTVWRMSKRWFVYAEDFRNAAVVRARAYQYCVQWFKINLRDGSISSMQEMNEVRSHIWVHQLFQGVISARIINNPTDDVNYGDYNRIINPSGSNMELSLGMPSSLTDSNNVPGWPDADRRYYAAEPLGTELYYVGPVQMNNLALDYRNVHFGQLLLDFAKLTNGIFDVNRGIGNSFNLIFGSRQYSINTLTISPDKIVSHDQRRFNLKVEDLPEVSTGIISNESFNRALSTFYSDYFPRTVVEHEIEVVRGKELEDINYDLYWELLINKLSYGHIQKYEINRMTVVFTTRQFEPNSAVEIST